MERDLTREIITIPQKRQKRMCLSSKKHRWSLLQKIVVPLIVLGIGCWFTSPLWQYPRLFFGTELKGDNIKSAHFYDFVGRNSWSKNNASDYFSQFDATNSPLITEYFPSIIEAQIMSPFVHLFDWPQHWPIILSASIILNAMSVLLLVYVLGGNRLAMLIASVGMLFLRPIWVDIVGGRINSITPCYALFAFAFILLTLPYSFQGQQRTWNVRCIGTIGAIIFGYISAMVYAPYLLLLIPFGLCFLIQYCRLRSIRDLLAPVSIIAITFGFCYTDLTTIYMFNDTKMSCLAVGCGTKEYSDSSTVDINNLFLYKPQSLTISGMSIFLWCSVCFVFVVRQKWLFISIPGLSILYGILAGGPCPSWYASNIPLLDDIWCWSVNMHDLRRFSTIAGSMLLVVLGLGTHEMWKIIVLRIPILISAFCLLFYMGQTRMTEILSEENWHKIPTVKVIPELVAKGDFVVELPYDQTIQYLSAMQIPDLTRLNPYQNQRYKAAPSLQWLQNLGYGNIHTPIPSKSEIAQTQLNWIFYDKSRCTHALDIKAACKETLPSTLVSILGMPDDIRGVWAWRIQPSQ